VAKAVAVVEPTNKASLSPARVADSSQKAEPKGTPAKLFPAKSEAKTTPAKSEAKSTPAKNESKPVITKEDSKSTPSKGECKPSELEKLAAAQASQMQKTERVEVSPIKAAPSTKPSTLSNVNEPVKSSDKPTKPSKSFEVVKPLNSPVDPVLRERHRPAILAHPEGLLQDRRAPGAALEHRLLRPSSGQ